MEPTSKTRGHMVMAFPGNAIGLGWSTLYVDWTWLIFATRRLDLVDLCYMEGGLSRSNCHGSRSAKRRYDLAILDVAETWTSMPLNRVTNAAPVGSYHLRSVLLRCRLTGSVGWPAGEYTQLFTKVLHIRWCLLLFAGGQVAEELSNVLFAHHLNKEQTLNRSM